MPVHRKRPSEKRGRADGPAIAPPVRQFVPMAGPREGVISETPPTLQRIAHEGGKDPSMTLRKLHRETGCSVSMLSRVFNGRRRISLRVAILVSKATGLPVETIAAILEDNRTAQISLSVLIPPAA